MYTGTFHSHSLLNSVLLSPSSKQFSYFSKDNNGYNFLSPNYISNHHQITPHSHHWYNTTKFHKVHDEIHLEQYQKAGKHPSYLLGIVLILQLVIILSNNTHHLHYLSYQPSVSLDQTCRTKSSKLSGTTQLCCSIICYAVV